MTLDELLDNLHWLGHDTFRLDGDVTIYFDPWKLDEAAPAADLILVSHDHFDHCSPRDVEQVSGPDTVVMAAAAAAAKLPGARAMAPGDRAEAAGVVVEAVSAYNTTKFRAPGQPFHPREDGHVGWVITVGGLRLYFAGDTDAIDEMADVTCDVALLPVSGTYVMTAEEAVEAAEGLGAQVVVPMHYGEIVGTLDDAKAFAEAYSGRTVLLQAE